MIRTKNIIPQIYNTSHDFQLFEAILDALFSEADISCAKLQGLHSPRQCFEENLGKLSRNLGIETSDRELLKKYRLMLKNKGTTEAVEAAILYCGAELVLAKDNLNGYGSVYYRDLSWKSDKDNPNFNIITYYIKSFKNFNKQLFEKLRKMILPFNVQIIFEIYEDKTI